MSAALQLVEQPDTADLQEEGSALVLRAQAIADIRDDDTFAAAVAFMNDCATRRKVIVEKFADAKATAYAAHKKVCALEAELLAVVDKAEREAKKRIGDYRAEQGLRSTAERLRLEEQARAQEEERLLLDAIEAEAAGQQEVAEAILAEPIPPPPVRVAPPTPKLAGVQFREAWKFRITNPLALVRHIAEHPEDLCYINWNTTTIQRDVTSRKGLFRKPGVEVYQDTTVAARGRR